jgi:hypothetical protein
VIHRQVIHYPFWLFCQRFTTDFSYIKCLLLGRITPSSFYYCNSNLLSEYQFIKIIMSYWPGGKFYGIPDLGPVEVEEGYYDFDDYGRLETRSGPVLLADRINPFSERSHNQRAPSAFRTSTPPPRRPEPARVQRVASDNIDRSLLDNWQTSLSTIENLFAEVLENRNRGDAPTYRRKRDQMESLLDSLKRAIHNRTPVA